MRATRCLATLLLALAACSRGQPDVAPRPTPDTPTAPGAIALVTGWSGRYAMVRTDSIAITLPTGAVQRQVLGQEARFTVWVGRDAKVTVRLDSLRVRPATATGMQDLVGATWTGTLTRDGIRSLRASRDDAFLGDLGEAIRSLFPSTPSGGFRAEARWADTTEAMRAVEAFLASDRRISTWTAGSRTTREGIEVLPLTLREQFEQIGKGEQGGREMTMTAQGIRLSSYYVSIGGRVDHVVHRDSVGKFITIPAGRQTIPTTQIVRIELRQLAAASMP
jgi:hypothetical protein